MEDSAWKRWNGASSVRGDEAAFIFVAYPTKIGVQPANRLWSRWCRPDGSFMECGMLFRLEEVTKTYGAVTALDNLSVSVPKGAVGLLGPNGSGETTMIRTLLGLITIDRGTG